jgi:hypothetical protein
MTRIRIRDIVSDRTATFHVPSSVGAGGKLQLSLDQLNYLTQWQDISWNNIAFILNNKLHICKDDNSLTFVSAFSTSHVQFHLKCRA